MTPEEAGRFSEPDEDPAEIFARFDAARDGGETGTGHIPVRRRDPADVRARLLSPDSPLPRDLAEELAIGLETCHPVVDPAASHMADDEPLSGKPSGAPSRAPAGVPPGVPAGASGSEPAGEPPSGAPDGAPPRRVRRGTRTFIRDHFECRPGGCGAQPGEPCVAYRATRWSDPPVGRPSTNVHAPRWRAYHAWLADQNRRQDPG